MLPSLVVRRSLTTEKRSSGIFGDLLREEQVGDAPQRASLEAARATP